MWTFFKILTFQEDKLSKLENKWEHNSKLSKTRKSNKSEISSNWRKTDWRLTCLIKSISWEKRRKKTRDFWQSTRNSRTRWVNLLNSTEEPNKKVNVRLHWTHRFFWLKISLMLLTHNDIKYLSISLFIFHLRFS